ncbi:MAG TPA: flagellar biosynthetic protein FliR [Fimbriimonadaceae bacterium]|nr:flagellar biosynthetic protein FliR [Fimbriimonadaceae bacterium]
MKLDEATLFAFLLVFVRCSAMLLASPVFGGPTMPGHIRVFTCVCIAGSLTVVLKPQIGPVADSIPGLALAVMGEAIAGLLIGGLISLVLQATQMAGAMLDVHIGLGMSQTLNPLTGVPVTVISQFKYMLGVVIFLSANAHHLMFRALVDSYNHAPALGANLPGIHTGVVSFLAAMTLLAVQIAAPVTAVSLIVDAALGLIAKAVPQMQALQVGIPAKVGVGIAALSLSLPPLVAAVTGGCHQAFILIHRIFGS